VSELENNKIEKNSDLNLAENYEELKRITQGHIDLFINAFKGHNKIFNDDGNVEIIIKNLKIIELYLNTKFSCYDYDFLSLVESELYTCTSYLNDYFENYNQSLNIEIKENDVSKRQDYLSLRSAKLNEFSLKLVSLNLTIESFLSLKENYSVVINNFTNNAIKKLDNELSSFRKLRSIVDNSKTENIYDTAVTKYKKLEKKYRKYFYRSVPIVIIVAIITFLSKSTLTERFGLDESSYWVLKISILLLGITLISYFIKQSSHYQRLADQNYQTQVELQAYPSFMESIPTEEAASVRKELALKYFGREIDGAAHKEMSNLISDQMKSTTEMVKATTEAIKNLKG